MGSFPDTDIDPKNVLNDNKTCFTFVDLGA